MRQNMQPTRVPQIASIMRWPSVDARDWAATVFPQLCGSPSVLAVVMFGSTIRPAPSSFDFDFLYIFAGERPDIAPPPMDVDVRAYEAETVEQRIAAGHDLLGWAIRLGALVCERDQYWSKLTARWKDKIPFPSADVAEARAVAAERLFNDLHEMGDSDAAIEQFLTALTHRGRAALLRANVFPASRPELPEQLRGIGESDLARALSEAIAQRNALAYVRVDASSHEVTDAA